MDRRTSAVCFALLCACGARSGLSVDGRAEHDAGMPVGFDTFPCRWSLTQPTLLAELGSGRFERLRGAVHGLRDEVLVLADHDGDRLGALIGLADPPVLMDLVDPELEAILGHRGGWIYLQERCRIAETRTPYAVDVVRTDYTGWDDCVLEQNDPEHLDLTLSMPGRVTVVSEHLATRVTQRADVAEPVGGTARSVHLQGLGWIVLSRSEGALRGYRIPEAGSPAGPFELGAQREGFAVALDRVRPAALVLRRDPAGRWRLERIPFADGLRALPLADLEGLEPSGTLVSNETEAMFPLRDGRVAVVPVDGSAIRFIGPVPEAPVHEMIVVVRPGSSGGGLLYAHGSRLTFRALTCNR